MNVLTDEEINYWHTFIIKVSSLVTVTSPTCPKSWIWISSNLYKFPSSPNTCRYMNVHIVGGYCTLCMHNMHPCKGSKEEINIRISYGVTKECWLYNPEENYSSKIKSSINNSREQKNKSANEVVLEEIIWKAVQDRAKANVMKEFVI